MARKTQDDPQGSEEVDGGPSLSPDEAANPLAAAGAALLGIAYNLQERKTAIMEAIDANRETLRNFVKQGALTEQQVAAVENLYPTRTRSSIEERVQRAQEALWKAQKARETGEAA